VRSLFRSLRGLERAICFVLGAVQLFTHEGLLALNGLIVGASLEAREAITTPLRSAPSGAVVAGRAPRVEVLTAFVDKVADDAGRLMRSEPEAALLHGAVVPS
jgi:hypothetical protein